MKTRRILFTVLLSFLLFAQSYATAILKETKVFAEKDGQKLSLDIYRNDEKTVQPCLMFVFGGGFMGGERDYKAYSSYFDFFAKNGFTVVSIDYRLGMKGVKSPSKLNFKPLQNAISIAVEDLYTATDYILKHASELNIDTSRIIISGSSAGAVTVLQADYIKRNDFPIATILPRNFQYAGVISFSGSIFSTKGLPSYKVAPAPTLFFHGNKDKMVPYNNIRFFNIGMFGSGSLTKRFKENGYPYMFYTMENIAHDVAEYPMSDFQAEILQFIQNFIFDKKPLRIEVNYYDKNRKSKMTMSTNEFYK